MVDAPADARLGLAQRATRRRLREVVRVVEVREKAALRRDQINELKRGAGFVSEKDKARPVSYQKQRSKRVPF